MPGNDGNRAGWVLTVRPPNWPRNASPVSFMKPARTTRLGLYAATCDVSAKSHPARVAKSATRHTKVGICARRARDSASMSSRSAPTAAIRTPYAESAVASMSACKLVPLPDTRTTIEPAFDPVSGVVVTMGEDIGRPRPLGPPVHTQERPIGLDPHATRPAAGDGACATVGAADARGSGHLHHPVALHRGRRGPTRMVRGRVGPRDAGHVQGWGTDPRHRVERRRPRHGVRAHRHGAAAICRLWPGQETSGLHQRGQYGGRGG